MQETATLALSDVIAALNALPEDQHREAVTALQNNSGPVVKAFRSAVFATGKAEGKKSGSAAAEELETARSEIERLTQELHDAQAKVPDAERLKADLTKQWERKVEAATKRAEAAEGTLTKERSSRFRTQFSAELADVADKDYRDEVLANRYADRYRVQPDGSWQVLRPGEDTPYEAATEAEAVKLLAADVAKLVPPKFRLAHGESGGGITNGNGGGGAQAPAKVEKERIDNARQAVQGAF